MLKIDLSKLLLVGILSVAAILLFLKLSNLMFFIGDFGWFYLAARDALLSKVIPLAGIPSSHPWLHQGPWWTYLLMIIFSIFNFNPITPAYFTALVGLISVFLVYRLTIEMFNQRIGLITTLLYSTSPLVVINARMPYHTALISILTILFIYAAYKWIKGKVIFFTLVIFLLALLYNFELATFPLWFVTAIIFIAGIYKKKKWAMQALSKKIILLSLLGFLVPMLPMLIYDFSHQFPQTIGFIIWMGYKVLTIFGFPSLHPEIASPGLSTVIVFAAQYYQRLIFINNSLIAFVVFIFSFAYFWFTVARQILKKQYHSNYLLLALVLSITLIVFFATKTISEAYLPIFFYTIILVTAIFFDSLFSVKKAQLIAILIIAFFSLFNSYTLLANNYFLGKNLYGPTMDQKINTAKEIIRLAKGREYNLIGKGQGSKFASFTMHYAYLTWWLGHGPTNTKQALKFIISENANGIVLNRQESIK